MNLTEALASAETKWEQGRLLSAKAQYEDLLSQYSVPTARAKISYEYAVMHYRHTGDGEEARRLFQAVMEQCAKVETEMDSQDREIEVNACENLMLLSLSYEEYDTWAGRLEKIAPRSKMLSDHREVVHDMKDKLAWFEAMHKFASTYYDPDPSKNVGLYASAAATLQLMLKNREALRFSRSDWGFATRAYAELVGLLTAKCGQNQERAGVAVNTQEFLFIAQGAIPLIEEYVISNPSDAVAQGQLRELNDLLKSTSSLGTATSQSVTSGWISDVVDRARKFFRGIVPEANRERKSQGSRTDDTPSWQTSQGLEQAIANSGLDGLRFELSSMNVEEDYVGDMLVLTFRPMDSLPPGKEHAAGLALRCIVGLTLPSLNAQTSGLRLQALPNPYTVSLGKGVQISPTLIMRGKDIAVPVKTSSRESEGNWFVEIKSVMIPRGESAKQFALLQRQLLEGLVPAFETLKPQPVRLSGHL